MTDVFVYFEDEVALALSDLEDAFSCAFSGIGRVTGTGAGQDGGNVDIEIRDGALTVAEIKTIVGKVMRDLGFTSKVEIDVDGEQHYVQ